MAIEQSERERQEMAAMAATMANKKKAALDGAAARERAEELKDSITEQIDKGNAPQTILYTAISAIGLLSHDTEWAEAAHAALDALYEDLEQDSFMVDNAAIEASRRGRKQTEYNDRLRRQIIRQLGGYGKIKKGLEDALAALDELEQQ